jgi:hypothetical protein
MDPATAQDLAAQPCGAATDQPRPDHRFGADHHHLKLARQ